VTRGLRWSENQLAAPRGDSHTNESQSTGKNGTNYTTATTPQDPTRRASELGAGASRRGSELPEVRPLERDVLRVVLAALRTHPAVAFAWRANTGSFEVQGRRIRAGFRGQSDVIGMLHGGRMLCCEVKRPGGTLTRDQAAFLARVQEHGGIALCATSVDDVVGALDAATVSVRRSRS
jgi:hypothetical protein